MRVFDDLHGTNQDERCRRERHGSSESLGSAVSGFRPWSAIDGTVRGPRSMAPCVARDRWHLAWPARDPHGSRVVPGLFFDDLHGRNRNKRCRRERHGSRGGFRFPCVRLPCVRGPRSMAPCVARERFKCKNTK